MIAQQTIEQVKSKVEIYDAVSRSVQLKKTGSTYEACCPFHHENTPSFKVNPARNRFKCFGCGESGNAVTFLMKAENLTFTEAIEALAATVGVEITYTDNVSKEEIQERKDKERERMKVLHFARDWYHSKLIEEPNPAMEYLNSRGVSLKTIKQWKLGYVPGGWYHLSHSFGERGQQTTAAEIGLLKKDSVPASDAYSNRVMIPMTDERGVLIGFTGRDLSGQSKAKYKNPIESPIYVKSEHVFGLFEAKKPIQEAKGIAFLVEGHFDLITMCAAGVENTVCTGGTALTPAQVVKIKKAGTSHIILMYDGDSAGQKAAEKATDICLKYDLRVELVLLPEGQDPDSWVRSTVAENQPVSS